MKMLCVSEHPRTTDKASNVCLVSGLGFTVAALPARHRTLKQPAVEVKGLRRFSVIPNP